MVKLLVFFLAFNLNAAFASVVHHKLKVEFTPEQNFLRVEDQVIPDEDVEFYEFELNPHLTVRNPEAMRLSERRWKIPVTGTAPKSIKINYDGTIFDPIKQDNSSGLITADGITLFGASYWYPQRQDDFVTFSIEASLPLGWSQVGQASTLDQPQEEIYLVAGPFFNYWGSPRVNLASHSVRLRRDERELADSYLSKIPEFIDHYANTIAPYPYRSFEVVENFWQTGFGMPSFTLLGSEVIRLPFLTTSSLPHEILHNWWGNSVYVDYHRGNWSEGLTTYLADHWQRIKAGTDSEYRRSTLAAFQDYVKDANDFPVRQFKGRHDAGTQAVGYGKAMFVFHMLRERLGQNVFDEGLRGFYRENIFKRVSFEEIELAMRQASRQDLGTFFGQWLDRKGMPTIALADVKSSDNRQAIKLRIRQSSRDGAPYEFTIPVVVTNSDGKAVRHQLVMNGAEQEFSLKVNSSAARVAIDPDFDVFRTFYFEEKPPTLSSVLSAPLVHFLKAESSPDQDAFIETWKKQIAESTEQVLSKDQAALPTRGALVFLGASHLAQEKFNQALAAQGVMVNDDQVTIAGQTYDRKDHAFLMMAMMGNQPGVWVFWPPGTDAARLASRLTHYGTFSVVGFKGQPNVLKKVWRVMQSPLIRDLPQF